MSAVFPEYERQLSALARSSAAGAPARRRQRSRLPVRAVVSMLTVCAAVGIFVVAIGSLGSSGLRAGDAAQASLRSLIAQYGVLRRPQTAADRALSGRAPILGATSRFGAGAMTSAGQPTSSYQVAASAIGSHEGRARVH